MLRSIFILFVLSAAAYGQGNVFEKMEISELKPHVDLRGFMLKRKRLTLRNVDLRNLGNILPLTRFDSNTTWPIKKLLPKSFNPEHLLKVRRNPGLGLRELHKQGITGVGVHVAIIDQPLLLQHDEYLRKDVNYHTVECEDAPPQMHGSAVVSILMGKSCGAAPGVELHYWAEPSWKRDHRYRAKALFEIIDYNNKTSREQKIRVVSVSKGLDEKDKNLPLWKMALQRAKQAGILVVHCGLNIVGAGCPLNKNPEEPRDYRMWHPFRGQEYRVRKEALFAPTDNRTYAGFMDTKEYVFSPTGGVSWAAPYIAGVAALGCQIDRDVTADTLWCSLYETGTDFHNGKLVNPTAFVQKIKGRLRDIKRTTTCKSERGTMTKKKTKRGCSGYYFFIQDQLEKLRQANTPYTGSNASKDFAEKWEALTAEEREKYNSWATSK